jgi:hypothetical protein
VNGGPLLTLDALVDFHAVHGDLLWRCDPEAHLVALHAGHGEGDLVPDHHGLSAPSCEN